MWSGILLPSLLSCGLKVLPSNSCSHSLDPFTGVCPHKSLACLFPSSVYFSDQDNSETCILHHISEFAHGIKPSHQCASELIIYSLLATYFPLSLAFYLPISFAPSNKPLEFKTLSLGKFIRRQVL